MKSKICFVIPQFGIIPGYVDFFIKTASYSANIADFIFFTDQDMKPNPVRNVFAEKITFEQFVTLAQTKLKCNLNVISAYKLCDLKPMYGLIFEDYLKQYLYWGHCDFDIIFGDIESLLKKNSFDRFDIFCTQRTYASGPFQIFRNVEKVNHFFMNSPSWRQVLSQPDYLGFDEAGDVIRELWKGKDIWDCPAKVHSMTHLLKNEELLERLHIKVMMKELITEKYTPGTEIHFDNGKLYVQPSNEELYIYHFMNRKNRTFFNDLLLSKDARTFTFTANGFFTGNKIEFSIGLIYSLIKRYWIRLARKVRFKMG